VQNVFFTAPLALRTTLSMPSSADAMKYTIRSSIKFTFPVSHFQD